jgi:hypothetical protein
MAPQILQFSPAPPLSKKSFGTEDGVESMVRCAKVAAIKARGDVLLGGPSLRPITFLCRSLQRSSNITSVVRSILLDSALVHTIRLVSFQVACLVRLHARGSAPHAQ